MALKLSDDFVESVKERRLLPFVGAGFSKNVHNDFPGWAEVIRRGAELLEYDHEVLTTQGDYLQIAEYLHAKSRLGTLYHDLARRLDDDRYDISSSRPHLLLPYLDVPSIFTTNWDSWIEKGFQHERISYSKVVTQHDFASRRTETPRGAAPKPAYPRIKLPKIRTRYDQTAIVKFHGDFSEHSSIVFRETDYFDRLDFEHPLDLKLRAEIIGRSVLFIGYSFSDPNVRYIWHKLTKLMNTMDGADHVKSFFVTHLNNPLQIELFRRKGIETILLTPSAIGAELAMLFEQMIDLQMS
jgi:hypothetical protein